jgi:MYXO-CTERM domain-containing protein
MLVFLVAGGFGSVYEIYEWVSDLHFGTHYQPDNFDTMTDMTANVVGGLAGGVLLVAAAGRRRREDPPV